MPTGALFRIALTFLATFIFFILRKKLITNLFENKVYLFLTSFFIFSIIPINFFPVLIDRINFFLIPIQIFVFSRLPYIFNIHRTQLYIHISIILLYLLVLMIWIMFATHVRFWLPYQNYLFI